MTITSELRHSLKQQSICSKCGSNWLELEQSLNEGIGSDNCLYALFMIRSCGVCRARWGEEYGKLIGGG